MTGQIEPTPEMRKQLIVALIDEATPRLVTEFIMETSLLEDVEQVRKNLLALMQMRNAYAPPDQTENLPMVQINIGESVRVHETEVPITLSEGDVAALEAEAARDPLLPSTDPEDAPDGPEPTLDELLAPMSFLKGAVPLDDTPLPADPSGDTPDD